ncbi:Uncharacterised protein [Mycobacteroides abscessus subsp. abscessus]|nr:Uncharacterised protein [Mycobacteroides abscessus subsp. abscessus]
MTSDITSCSAISELVAPEAMSASTSSSRAVSLSWASPDTAAGARR